MIWCKSQILFVSHPPAILTIRLYSTYPALSNLDGVNVTGQK